MSAYKIKQVTARQVFDSRANPTVEVDVTLENGAVGRGTVPSGASTGIYEALELRDGDAARFNGKGVSKALGNINNILAPAITGMCATDQAAIDNKMITLDGTPTKSNLGANAILGCSMAVAWAAANAANQPLFRYLGGCNARTLPVPMIQIIGGGAHAIGSVDIQDYLVVPMSAKNFEQGFEMVVNVYNATKKVFAKAGKPLATADEGGFWPTDFKSNEEGLALITEGISAAGYKPGEDVSIALDIASSEFYNKDKGTYSLHLENLELPREKFVDMLCGWVDKYPIISIEDGSSELDWDGAVMLTQKLGKRIQLVGDDLFTTSIPRVAEGVKRKACNAVLIKMNQIGTLTETLDAIEYTKSVGYLPVVSARSGETEDHTIVHLSIAANCGQLKVGSVARGERTVKWNECIRMEQLLGSQGVYPSGEIFKRVMI
ncbi:MAG: phosphopyruvate hydratase [Defluviitaleaceae bacterium]|nr:phosphopyruvate hydratase [Defluviitaleaceae bacterium]